MAQTYIQDGDRTVGSGAQVHGVQNVGHVAFKFQHPLLKLIIAGWNDDTPITLTGFKLESTLISADPAIDNSKLVPLLNGDTMTLTNANKSGTLSIACTRTAAGVEGGDLVAIADYIRSQGDNDGGTLTVEWLLNGVTKSITFKKVTVRRCIPLTLAGNDLPDYNVQLNYATYNDSDFPSAIS